VSCHPEKSGVLGSRASEFHGEQDMRCHRSHLLRTTASNRIFGRRSWPWRSPQPSWVDCAPPRRTCRQTRCASYDITGIGNHFVRSDRPIESDAEGRFAENNTFVLVLAAASGQARSSDDNVMGELAGGLLGLDEVEGVERLYTKDPPLERPSSLTVR
jgi:hypothetical protein